MTTTAGETNPGLCGVSRLKLADHLDDGLDMVYRRLGKDAVTQVENMAGTRSGAAEQFVYADLELGHRSKEHHRVQIALNRRAVADIHPSLVDIEAPVNAHDVAS